MKKTFFSLILIFALLVGTISAFAVAGGEDDPLISLSYIKNWADNLVASASGNAKNDLTDFGKKAIASSKTYPVSYATPYVMVSDATMTLGDGCSFILSSGASKVNVTRGTLVNTSTGRSASSGNVTAGQMYVVCENSSVTLTFSAASVILVNGHAATSGNAAFTDVAPHEWFFPYVTLGVELGLIHGMTENTFAPDRTLTIAETITLAAQIHRLNETGNTNIPSTGTIWYDTYRSYCIQQGIIDQSYAGYTDAQMNAPATRSEFVHIFYHAMPEDGYPVLNEIPDNSIPDLKLADPYGDEIYTFYRAGILTGYTNTAGYIDHSFGSDTNIRRNEMSVILVHLVEPSTRVSFTIE